MPGRRLNDIERHLLHLWAQNAEQPYPSIRGLRVKGRPGLRGIRDLYVPFNYPITAMCGKNGSGKTTVISLAALAFHSPVGHFPRLATKGDESRSYYTFADFFFKGPDDPDITGLKITWEYSGEVPPVTVTKQSKKWMHYERRPPRPVHYFGVSRSVPAAELKALRYHFGSHKSASVSGVLSAQYRARLGDMMSRSYKRADSLASQKYTLRTCKSASAYSSFNMGAGEDILIELLLTLQDAQEGTLIVIEEVELGLHPEALISLAKQMEEIALEKHIQFIVSSHSQQFIDSIPQEARVLIQRAGLEHNVMLRPTTSYAMGAMSGRAQPELKVYCEDEFSERLVSKSMPGALRRRVELVPVGDGSELLRQAMYHCRGRFKSGILLIWDGDYRAEAARQVSKLQKRMTGDELARLNWTFLPGKKPPEVWAASCLNGVQGAKLLATELSDDERTVAGYIERLCSLANGHRIPYELHQLTNLSEEEASEILAKSVARLPHAPLSPIRRAVEAVLGGDRVLEGIPLQEKLWLNGPSTT